MIFPVLGWCIFPAGIEWAPIGTIAGAFGADNMPDAAVGGAGRITCCD